MLPPLVIFALKVTFEPAQTLVPEVLITMVGVALEPTVIVKLFEVAEEGTAQVALLVNTTVTTSLLDKVVVVKVAEFVPTLFPLTFH